MEKTPLHNTRIGRAGEDHAVGWLERNGFRIVERNWRCARGEIDVVAWDDRTLVFVEVKTRTGTTTGHPFEALTAVKVARLRRLVPAWFSDHPGVTARAVRVDAVAVHLADDRVAFEHLAGVS
jgi:putative endonuclease